MTIAVFGATGHLGDHILDALTHRGVDAGRILALGRNRQRLEELERHGFRTAVVDLDSPEGLAETLEGVEKAVLVSTGNPGQRVRQHTAAVEALKAAGVKLVAYTSLLDAGTSDHVLAPDHRETERLVRDSGLDWVFLRNGWYTENQKGEFEMARTNHAITTSVGPDARLATAPRKDYAEAVAVVLTEDGHAGQTYELSGDTAWTFPEFAETAGKVLGEDVAYQHVSAENEKKGMEAAGLDAGTIEFVAALNADTDRGLLATTTGDLSRLIGHPTEPLEETMKSWR